MNSSGGHYPYVGDDPASVNSAVNDLGELGNFLGTLAGEVEHDMASMQESFPDGSTGQAAAADATRMGMALDECHRVFVRAERALSELYPVLLAGRRRIDELNDVYADYLLAGPKTKSGFVSLGHINRAYDKVRTQVSEETDDCNHLLKQLTDEGAAPAGHAVRSSRYDLAFGLLMALSDSDIADIRAGRICFPTDPAGVHDPLLLMSPDQGRRCWLVNRCGSASSGPRIVTPLAEPR